LTYWLADLKLKAFGCEHVEADTENYLTNFKHISFPVSKTHFGLLKNINY